MEGGGGGAEEISARVRAWCQLRAPDDALRRALAHAADTAHRAQRKYDKVHTSHTHTTLTSISGRHRVCVC